MKVNLEYTKIAHFLLLLGLTLLGGWVLMDRYEWPHLSAFGFSCTVTVQLSNLLLKLLVYKDGKDDDVTTGKNRQMKGTGNPKKKN
jgi:hypothetical protein